MRRRRRGYYDNDYNGYNDSNAILLVDFLFFNKTKQVINDKELVKIQKQLAKPNFSTLYWTNTILAKHGVGFLFSKSNKEIYIEILTFDYKFKAAEFNKCKKIIRNIYFLTFEPDDELDEILNNSPSNKIKEKIVNEKGYMIQYLHNKQAVLTFLIENKLFNDNEINDYWKNYVATVNSIFDEIILDEKKQPIFTNSNSGYSNAYYIIKVVEKRLYGINYRLAFLINFANYNTNYEIYVYKETDKEYNYIDDNRVFFKANNTKYFIADGLITKNANNEININFDVIKKMEKNINQLVKKDTIVISPSIYKFYMDKVMNFEQYTNEEFLSQKEQLICEQYRTLLEQGRTIKFGDISVSSNDSTYIIKLFNNEMILECKNDFLNIAKHIFDVRNAVNIKNAQFNYNTIWENILGLSIVREINSGNVKESEYQQFEQTSFKINGINVELTKDSNRMKINGIFCRIADVYHILCKLICFKSQNDFDMYVKDISYIGVEWKRMIATGVLLNLSNPFSAIIQKFDNEYNIHEFYMRFSLLWDANKRNRVYLILNGTKYLIKYKGKFKQFFNRPTITLSMKTLKEKLTECLENIDDTKILDIVQNAIEEAKIVQQRGKELIADTVININAKETEQEINGMKIKGFIIIGIKTKAKYFVSATELKVYRLTNNEWNQRCVVSAHDKDRIFEDRLANRLINIYNEPSYIRTIG